MALHGVPPVSAYGLCYADGCICFLFFMYDGLFEMHSSLGYYYLCDQLFGFYFLVHV